MDRTLPARPAAVIVRRTLREWSSAELLAECRSRGLLCTTCQADETIVLPGITIDVVAHLVIRATESFVLNGHRWGIVYTIARAHGHGHRGIPSAQIVRAVWPGWDWAEGRKSLASYIHDLRLEHPGLICRIDQGQTRAWAVYALGLHEAVA